jgi:hypothetical protein
LPDPLLPVVKVATPGHRLHTYPSKTRQAQSGPEGSVACPL